MTPDDVVARSTPQEVVELALALGNIDSPTGQRRAGRRLRPRLADRERVPRRAPSP